MTDSKENQHLETWIHYFSKCKLAPHYFSKCKLAPHYFSKCNSAPYFLSQRLIIALSYFQTLVLFPEIVSQSALSQGFIFFHSALSQGFHIFGHLCYFPEIVSQSALSQRFYFLSKRFIIALLFNFSKCKKALYHSAFIQFF